MQQFEAEVCDISDRLPIELGGLSRSVSFDLSRDDVPELFIQIGLHTKVDWKRYRDVMQLRVRFYTYASRY